MTVGRPGVAFPRLTLSLGRGISDNAQTNFSQGGWLPMFGCGESVGRGSLMFRDEVAQAAYAPPADRVRHVDTVNQA